MKEDVLEPLDQTLCDDPEFIDKLVENLVKTTSVESRKRYLAKNRLWKYQDDPVGFGERELGERYTDDVKAIMESVRDHQITIAKSATGTGKTHASSSIVIWFYKCFPNSRVYTTAAPPEDNLKKLLWGEIGRKVARYPELFADDKVGVMNIARNSWSFVTGVTIPTTGSSEEKESKFSGKHAPYLLFVLDEGDAIPDEVYRGIDGCMSGGMARMLIMFNPKRQAGEAYRYIREGRANVIELSAFDHPNVVTGRDVFPGAVTRDKTLQRINRWTIPLAPSEEPDSNCFEVPISLVDQVTTNEKGQPYPPLPGGWRRITDQQFSYKVLAQYPAAGSDQLIPREWVQAAQTRWLSFVVKYGEDPLAELTPSGEENPMLQMRPIMGLDVADLGDDWSMVCKRYGDWTSRINGWNGVDPNDTTDRAEDEARHCRSLMVNVDSVGVGASVSSALKKRGIRANRVMVSEKPTEKPPIEMKAEFGILRDQLWWETREWLRPPSNAMLPPDEKLEEELVLPTYEERGGKIRIMSKENMRKALGRSPDIAESLILTFAPKEPRPHVRVVG